MVHDWRYQDLLLLGLLWLISMLLYWAWLRGRSATSPTFPSPAKPIKKRTQQPKPFAGLLHKPLCDACEHAAESRPQAPCAPPPRLTFTRGLAPHGRYSAAVLPRQGLLLLWLERSRRHPRPWPSRGQAMAAVPVCVVPWLFP
jgi:hypothetical protein